MVTARIKTTKENAWDFIKFYMLSKTGKHKLILGLCASGAFALIIAGIIMAVITKTIMILFSALVAVLILTAYACVFIMMMKNTAKKLYESCENRGEIDLSMDENLIMAAQDGKPIAVYGWDQVEEAYAGPKAFYMLIRDGALIIIEYGAVTGGGKDELLKISEGSRDKTGRKKK